MSDSIIENKPKSNPRFDWIVSKRDDYFEAKIFSINEKYEYTHTETYKFRYPPDFMDISRAMQSGNKS